MELKKKIWWGGQKIFFWGGGQKNIFFCGGPKIFFLEGVKKKLGGVQKNIVVNFVEITKN